MSEEKKVRPRRLVQSTQAEKRNFSANLKLQSWLQLKKMGRVPEKFKNDFDAAGFEKILHASNEKSQQLRMYIKSNEVKNQEIYKNLVAKKNDVRANSRDQIAEIKKKFLEQVEKLRAEKDAAIEKIKNERNQDALSCDEEIKKLKLQKNEKIKIQSELTDIHERVGVQTEILDGLIAASFPGNANEELRTAIRRGDNQFIAGLTNSKNLL